ncbi:MAG: hypothetical protein FJ297_12280 [Planctomycetes bacterium]|nr:hypothetical protein [Planctomycetota bacterium]
MKRRLPFMTLWIALGVTAIGCVSPVGHNLPPAERLMEPGPGVGGPGPGVIPPVAPVAAVMPAMMGPAMQQPTVQVLFAKPESLQVRWDVSGVGQFDSTPLITPGRHEFPEGAIYRLKLTGIPGREGVELYPTLEVANTTPRTAAYLAHNAIPAQFTEEDFEQVMAGNFVTKVIYLPDPEFQRLALAGVETLVSTRLDPGVDPIVEADQRGSIMAVIRIGNKDVELSGASADAGLASLGGMPGADAFCMPAGGYAAMPGYVAGATAPLYGMPITGTPIGLPGPPHIPLGGPAGLQKHVIRNHTFQHIPEPNPKFVMHVRQQPGFSYPTPPSRMYVREQSFYPQTLNTQPYHARSTEVQ